ncbi:hypothetical protein Hanom_Chr15g01379271 [Helianthus anomalus]
MVLEDYEVDQVTGFSTAGGLMENLDAHLHGGRTPRDRPLGSGGAVDVDSAHALEKYVPDWSLANKDRIMDALSAKMALFHLGTPAEHAYYRKMSAYKRWVEAESNSRRFEREVASLKNEDNVRSKTKQEISSLRAQADRLKEQVSEAKEVSKASQTSAAAAYEARNKAIRDFEDVKLKFEELKKKLSEVEEKNEAK